MNAGVRLGDDVVPGRVGPPLPGVEHRAHRDDDGATIDVTDDETIGEIASAARTSSRAT